MAVKNSLFGLTVASFVFVVGCKSTPPPRQTSPILPKRTSPQPIVKAPGLTVGGDQREDDFSGIPAAEPQVQTPSLPPQDVPKKVAVILGPGGGKTFAHVGVLKAFQNQRIPIAKVVGLEWGALMGGLYATKGAVHDMEWKLYKMEQQNLPHPKGFFTRKGVGEESVKVMDGFLKEAFARDDLNSGKVAFTCPARSIWTGVVNWQTRGSYGEAVKKCLAYPPVFKANGTFLAGASQATEAIERLVKEGYNVIVFVNVLGSAMPVAQDGLADNLIHVILWQEVKRAMGEASKYNIDIVNVDTSNYPIASFDGKKDLIVLGERVGGVAAAALVNKYRF